MIAAAALMTAACRKESADDGKVDFLLTVRMPISVENPVLKSIGVTFTDVATGGKTDVAEFASAGEGTYTVVLFERRELPLTFTYCHDILSPGKYACASVVRSDATYPRIRSDSQCLRRMDASNVPTSFRNVFILKHTCVSQTHENYIHHSPCGTCTALWSYTRISPFHRQVLFWITTVSGFQA